MSVCVWAFDFITQFHFLHSFNETDSSAFGLSPGYHSFLCLRPKPRRREGPKANTQTQQHKQNNLTKIGWKEKCRANLLEYQLAIYAFHSPTVFAIYTFTTTTTKLNNFSYIYKTSAIPLTSLFSPPFISFFNSG